MINIIYRRIKYTKFICIFNFFYAILYFLYLFSKPNQLGINKIRTCFLICIRHFKICNFRTLCNTIFILTIYYSANFIPGANEYCGKNQPSTVLVS